MKNSKYSLIVNHHALHLTAIISILLSVTNCSEQEYHLSPPYKAIVLNFTGTNADGKALYALTEKPFRTLTDFNQLDGTYLNIKRGGALTVKEVNGSIVSSDSYAGGKEPGLRYNVQSGVALALDYSTLAMLSAYYQIDEIYSTLAEKTGVNPFDLQVNLPGGKHTMLFEPEIKLTGTGSEMTAGEKLNAAFSPSDKKFLLLQRSPIENVPLAANFQVLTHEFGHFVFDFSFFGGKTARDNRWAEEWAISGINEGFADFFSWTFTDSTDILRSSISIDDVATERDFGRSTFTYSDLKSSAQTACNGDFYCVGTLFARSLYQTQKALTSTVSKKSMASGVIEALKQCQSAMNELSSSIMPAKTNRDSLSYSEAYSYDGKVIGGFLRSFVLNAPSAWKTELCRALKDNFGTSGFPIAARTGSCD
jgi:hypothetical protein